MQLVAKHFEFEDGQHHYRCRFDKDKSGWIANVWFVSQAPAAFVVVFQNSEVTATQATAKRLIAAAIKKFGPKIEEPASA